MFRLGKNKLIAANEGEEIAPPQIMTNSSRPTEITRGRCTMLTIIGNTKVSPTDNRQSLFKYNEVYSFVVFVSFLGFTACIRSLCLEGHFYVKSYNNWVITSLCWSGYKSARLQKSIEISSDRHRKHLKEKFWVNIWLHGYSLRFDN